MKQIDYFICSFISLFLVFSNSFVYKVAANKYLLETNFTNRAITLILFFLISLFLLFKIKRIHKSSALLMFFLFVFYAIVLDLLKISSESISVILRWVSYLFIFCFFSSFTKAQEYLKFIVLLTCFILSICTLVLFFSGWYLDINGGHRATSVFGSPIGLASFLYVSSLVIHFFYLTNKLKLSWNLLFQILIFLSILLTVTRLITIFFIFSYLIIALSSIKLKFTHLIITLIVFVVLSYTLFFVLTETAVGSRLDSLLSNDISSDSSTLFRIYILNNVFESITGFELLFGIGLGLFPIWFESFTGVSNVAPHFEILWLIVEMGLFGTIIFLLFYYCLFKKIMMFKTSKIKCTLLFICFAQIFALQLSNPAYFYQIMFFIVAVQGLICNKINNLMDF